MCIFPTWKQTLTFPYQHQQLPSLRLTIVFAKGLAWAVHGIAVMFATVKPQAVCATARFETENLDGFSCEKDLCPTIPKPEPTTNIPSSHPKAGSSGDSNGKQPTIECGCLQDAKGNCFLTRGNQKIPVGTTKNTCVPHCVTQAATHCCSY